MLELMKVWWFRRITSTICILSFLQTEIHEFGHQKNIFYYKNQICSITIFNISSSKGLTVYYKAQFLN